MCNYTFNIKKKNGSLETIELEDSVPEFYINSQKYNAMLNAIRIGMTTWVDDDFFKKMNVTLGIYENVYSTNAISHYDKNTGKNYICISLGLICRFWKLAKECVNHKNFEKVFRVEKGAKNELINIIFNFMINFIVAHEFGHIAHGHLLNTPSSTFEEADGNELNEADKEENWNTQLKEYDADWYAATISAKYLLSRWPEDEKIQLINNDILFISTYLCYRALSEATRRDFSSYFEKDIKAYDHPHQGIRMFYTMIFYADVYISNEQLVKNYYLLLTSGVNAVVSYEKNVLGKEKLTETFYNVYLTKRGSDHVKNLNNDWRKKVSKYNKKAYIHIPRLSFIDEIPLNWDLNKG